MDSNIQDENIIDSADMITLMDGTTYTYEDIENTILAVADKHFSDGANIYQVNQSRWQAVLIEAGKILFRREALKDPKEGKVTMYNREIISKLTDAYIYISKKYSKMVSLNTFGMFCNMPFETVRDWQNVNQLTDVAYRQRQKIMEGQSDSIINKLYDSNNVTGQAMLANNLLGWNTSRSSNESTVRRESISTLADDFSALGIGENNNILIE